MKNKGFTIIETMVSVIIIMTGIIQISSIIIHSLKLSKKTNDIFYIEQKANFIRNKLLSIAFNSIEIKEGETKKHEDGYEIILRITNRSDSLKEFHLSVSKNKIKKNYSFIRSKYIN